MNDVGTMIDKEKILNEIKRTAAQNGGQPLGVRRFEKETGIKQQDWAGRYWARWSDALKEAGFQGNKLQTAYDREFILKNVIILARRLGHVPTNFECRMEARASRGFPHYTTILAHFGGVNELVTAIRNYCSRHESFDDVVRLCDIKAAQKNSSNNIDDNASSPIYGYVYLLRSGKAFKIGRSNAVGRRQYELTIQLPERVQLIHEIRTDDPVGIEKYWHERFADKRMNGEWFALGSSDVSAFRRRKFM